jgi:periplasmic protein CpxP/Spy
MKRNLSIPVVGALLSAALVLPVGVLAQSQPSAAPAQAAPPAAAPATGNTTMEQRIEQRITRLHAALQITAAEEPQWQQFAGVMRDNARKMDQDYKDRAAKFDGLNALDNMRSYAQIAQEHAEDSQRLVAAFEPLYSAMSDAQKHIADQVFRNTPPHHG